MRVYYSTVSQFCFSVPCSTCHTMQHFILRPRPAYSSNPYWPRPMGEWGLEDLSENFALLSELFLYKLLVLEDLEEK